MAKIRDYAVTILPSNLNAICSMPVHQTGDLLVAFVGKDGTPVVNTPANWSATAATGASVGAFGGIWTRRAQSSAETVTFTTGTAAPWAITIVSISGTFGTLANGSDALSVAATIGATDSTSPFVGTAVTPAHANSLVISGIFTDATFGIQSDPGWVHLFTGDSGANSIAVAYTVASQASISVPTPNWRSGTGVDDDTRVCMIAIRDSGTLDELDCYIDRTIPPSFLLASLHGGPIGDVNSVAYIAAASATLTSLQVNGITPITSTASAVTATADAGFNPYRSVATTPGTASTTALGHSEVTGTFNMTQGEGLLFGVFRPTIPRDFIDLGNSRQGGVFINFTNGTTAAASAWVVGAQFSTTTKQADYNPFVIQVQQTNNTRYAWAGTVNWAAVTRFSFGASSFYGAASVQFSNLYMLNRAVLVGGTTARPFGIRDIVATINMGAGFIPVTSLAGSTITSYIPIQFGNSGTNRCNVRLNLATIQFPRRANSTTHLDFHVDPNRVGVEIFGSGNTDSFIFQNVVFTSESQYYWRINASSSVNSIYSFSGSSIINSGIVTLRAVTTFDDMSFIECPNITQNGALITNSTFNNSLIESNNPGNIRTCIFAGDNIGHAITITAPGTYSFIGNTFNGFGASGTTNAAVFNNSGGNVVLNVTSGGSIPTVLNGVGASTTVNAAANLTLTGLIADSEIRVYTGTLVNPEVAVEIAGIESSGTSFVFSQSVSGQAGYIQIFHIEFQPVIIELVFSGLDQSIPIQQIMDRQYARGSISIPG